VLRLLWHLPNFAKLYWRLFTDRRVPLRAKAVLVTAMRAAKTSARNECEPSAKKASSGP